MASSRVYGEPPTRSTGAAGVITKIHLENFMCHSSLDIVLGEWLNFITGQNGSGKSAILTALCVAFGCRARGTQRAATLKDFIKTGCSYSLVKVEIKNEGEDAFKPDIYGELIIIERRITESTSSTVLKDHRGNKVASRREELNELVEHFNIDVENPCVIMSQDKSREFLHSGNDRDKFKFFFKATLLQQVNDLLQSIATKLDAANAVVDELESSIRPVLEELRELESKIKSMKQAEEITQQIDKLKKKLAWALVYDIDKDIEETRALIESRRGRIPQCQLKIDKKTSILEGLRQRFAEKKTQIASLMEKTSEVRRMKDELQHDLSLGTRERLELQGEYDWKSNNLKKMKKQVRVLEQQAMEIHEQHVKSTQAEECEIEEKLKHLQNDFDEATSILIRLQEEESALSERLSMAMDEISKIASEVQGNEKRFNEIRTSIRELQQNQTNKVTAFGGGRVIQLLHAIERHHQKFKKLPIGPIGSHLNLIDGDMWAPAAECAFGRLLDAFIVNDHKDSILLRGCAREANYNNLQIIIYDFSRPKLRIPSHMLPGTNHPTAFSVVDSDNATVMNVLVDMGHAERQVLVRDYGVGKTVAFDRRISNVKEVFTLEGHKMFARGSVETILPPNKRARTGRLCSSFDGQINVLEKDASNVQEQVNISRGRKRNAENELHDIQNKLQNVKRRRVNAERDVMSKKLALQDTRNSYTAEASSSPTSSVDEIQREISKIQEQVQEQEIMLESLEVRMKEAESKSNKLKLSFENLCESAKGDIDAFEAAEHELVVIEDDIRSAEAERIHYEGVMNNKVLHDIKTLEEKIVTLEEKRKDGYEKASIICPESDTEASGSNEGPTSEQLKDQIKLLTRRCERESQRFTEPLEELTAVYDKKQRKIMRKQQTYESFRNKLDACKRAVELRWSKFQRNATFLKRELTWQFNDLLGKKGISGHIIVSYEEKTLSIEVKMPQDASRNVVRDTRGLSGGERSFSTLCFALALHKMTEAPFRAMDEFDVFMDAVSRKISLDTLVDFALQQGSQWIFITPHDIGMVKQGERIKKQQMAAPRS